MESNRVFVLACIDGSAFASSVVDYAAWISRTVNAPLKLLHHIERRAQPALADLSGNLRLGEREGLLEELAAMEERRSKILMEQGNEMLESARLRAEANGVNDAEKFQRSGSLLDSLIELENEIRVLVLGARGENGDVGKKEWGGQLEAVIRTMHQPVLVVNRDFREPPRRCMLAYDGSEQARKALAMVAQSPLFRGIECHVVHVSREAHSPVLDEATTSLRNASISVVTASLHGDVERQLEDYQQRHDIGLIVMGAFGQNRLRELLFGSVTQHMLANASVPLLLLR